MVFPGSRDGIAEGKPVTDENPLAAVVDFKGKFGPQVGILRDSPNGGAGAVGCGEVFDGRRRSRRIEIRLEPDLT